MLEPTGSDFIVTGPIENGWNGSTEMFDGFNFSGVEFEMSEGTVHGTPPLRAVLANLKHVEPFRSL